MYSLFVFVLYFGSDFVWGKTRNRNIRPRVSQLYLVFTLPLQTSLSITVISDASTCISIVRISSEAFEVRLSQREK